MIQIFAEWFFGPDIWMGCLFSMPFVSVIWIAVVIWIMRGRQV